MRILIIEDDRSIAVKKSLVECFDLLSPAALSQDRHRAWVSSDPILLWHAFTRGARAVEDSAARPPEEKTQWASQCD